MADAGPGTGAAAWQRFLDPLLEGSDDETPIILARVALLTDPTLETPSQVTTSGLPGGRPNRALTRAAAAALLEHGRDGTDQVALTWRFLGLQQRHKHYKEPRPGEADELPAVLSDLEEATEVGAALGPELHAWALIRFARALRDAHRNDAGRTAADRAVALLEPLPAAADDPFPHLAEATGHPPWLPTHRFARTYLLMKAHSRAAIAARMHRDYERSTAHRERQLELSRQLPERPWLLVGALGVRASLARVLGDMTTALQLLAEQDAVADASGSRLARIRRLRSAAVATRFLDDWDGSTALRRERIVERLEPYVAVPAAEPGPLLAAVPALERDGRRAVLTGLGNDAYEIAFNLVESGRASVEAAAADEARLWLDVADAAWRDIELNGRVAVGFRRLQLDALTGVADDPTAIGRAMVAASRNWRRAAGQRRSAITAVRFGAAGDRVVLDRLIELLDDAPAVDTAHLRVGVARWHLRYGSALAADGQAAAADRAWSQATDHALAAADGLSVPRPDGPPVLLDATAVVEAQRIAADALRARRTAGARSPAVSAPAELAVRVAALAAVAQRFTASGTPRQRLVLEELYGPWLVETLRLAVEVGDATAADRTAEVLRRDLVGAVLVAIADDPLAPEQIAALARQLTATLRAQPVGVEADTAAPTPTAGPADDDGEPDPADGDPGVRALRMTDQLDETLDVVGTVLGPMARSLFDPRTTLAHTTETAAGTLYADGPGVLLSLVLVTTPDGPRVVRRMVWRAGPGGALQEHLDEVATPAWLPGLAVDDDPELFFGRVARLTDVLLPGPLVALLAAADPAHPVLVTVVPTGLLAVPFAALPVGGRRLLDLAVLCVVQSLQAIESLARPDVEPGVESLEVGVYDEERLQHAGTEWKALRRYGRDVRRASSLGELGVLLGDRRARGGPGLFALAVHGSRGADGWTQAKQLPSGELLTAGHVLQWYLPALVIGASCNTDIRADSGGELGGFPLAFQLRGAVDIIGALHYIEDEATAKIMELFYAATAEGMGAAAALRRAQRAWIAADRPHRAAATERWAYLLCYGLPR